MQGNDDPFDQEKHGLGAALDDLDGNPDEQVGEKVEPEHDLDVKQFQPDPVSDDDGMVE